MDEIKLGDKVKCKYTGFIGIAVARTEYINGCVQYSIIGKIMKDGKYPEELSIDRESLEIVSKKKPIKKTIKKFAGGATVKATSMRGY